MAREDKAGVLFELDPETERRLQEVVKQILRYLRERIATPEDPRRFGKALAADRAGLWRYRVGATASSAASKTGAQSS